MDEHLDPIDGLNSFVVRNATMSESAAAHSRYIVECFDSDGNLKWDDIIDNVVQTEGKNLAFDTFLAGSSYTVTGPYMGLVSSVSYTAISAADTGVQINGTNGWKEAGGANAPTYTGNRKTISWSAASAGAKATSAAVVFAITGTGTVKGAFVLYGSGALTTKDDAHGTLWSTGLFSAGDKSVSNGDTINVSYSTSM